MTERGSEAARNTGQRPEVSGFNEEEKVMTEKRKKGSGYEDVKRYVLRRLEERPRQDDPFVRIAGDEIAAALGISAQMANAHVRTLVGQGVFHRERRCYYRELQATDPPPVRDPVSLIMPTGSGAAEGPFPSSMEPIMLPPESFLVPAGDILGTFTDLSGKKYLVFRNLREVLHPESGNIRASIPEVSETTASDSLETFGNIRTSFPEVSETTAPDSLETFGNIRTNFPEVSETAKSGFSETFGNISETSERSKKELQEKINENKKEKNVDFLKDWVDVTNEDYLKARDYAVKLFNRYGAGVRKGTNPILINRFVAGFRLKIPLINFQELEEQLKQAEQETAQYESFRGFGKQSGIRRPYIRIANYLKKCYEAAGWTWTKLTTPFAFRLNRAHREAGDAPLFPHVRTEQESVKTASASQSVLAIPTEQQLAAAEPMPRPLEKPLSPSDIKRIIEKAGIGKMPPADPPGRRVS